MSAIAQNIRFGIRSLCARPGFAFAAIATLALGIGATTAIFSIVNALVLRALPFPDANRIVLVREVGRNGGQLSMAQANFEDLQTSNRSFEALAVAAGSFPLVVTGGREAERARISIVSGGFLNVMGVRPLAGRTFLPDEDKYGGPVAVLLSYGYWQRAL